MLAFVSTALLLSMQTPQVDGFSQTSNRNRKMIFGKSKASFQPFLCKSENPVDSVTVTSGSTSTVVDSGMNRVQVYDSTSGGLNPIQVLEEINKQRRKNNMAIPVSLYPTLSEFESMSLTKTSADACSHPLQQQEQPQKQQQQQQQEQPQQQQQLLQDAPTLQRSWQKPKSSSGLANIYWRSVDVDDLRTHPYFNSLPLPDDVFASNAVEYSLFRQDSWQWGALHAGRLTTARAAACLGFYEQESARILKVPRSLSGHSKALHAYEHLQEPAPDSWAFLNQDYIIKHPEMALKISQETGEGRSSVPSNQEVIEGEEIVIKGRRKRGGYQSRPEEGPKTPKPQQKKSDVWIPIKATKSSIEPVVSTKSSATPEVGKGGEINAGTATAIRPTKSTFPFTYRPKGKHAGERGYSSASHARMAWGSSQEATAVLVAVNYFQAHGMHLLNSTGTHSHTIVEEAGMFPFEALSDPMPSLPAHSEQLLRWVSDGSLPIIGASPDGMLRHPDGSCEVLEVKCHSPFIETRTYNNYNTSNSNSGSRGGRGGGRGSGSGAGGLSISDRGAADTVATWHIPQLQLHILCAGPACTGAVLVSLSATKGANIFRVKRDDEYIMRMMTWIRKFYTTYVLSNKKNIPENYFLKDSGYAEFLNATLKICADASLVAHVPDTDVQRSPLNGKFFI